MISITRPKTVPPTLKSEKVKTLLKKLAALTSRKSSDFEPHWNSDDVRTSLWEMQYRKCSYCERTRELKYEPDVEHFRPKAGVTECDGKDGYWWLAYEWTNLFFSCRICNQKYKKNHFPIAAGSKRASGPGDSITSEKIMLVDPAREDPEEVLSWDWTRRVGKIRFVYPCWRDERGQETVRVLGLDHPELARERGTVVDVMLQLISDYKRMLEGGVEKSNEAFRIREYLLREELSADRPFLGLKRYMIRASSLDHLLKPTRK